MFNAPLRAVSALCGLMMIYAQPGKADNCSLEVGSRITSEVTSDLTNQLFSNLQLERGQFESAVDYSARISHELESLLGDGVILELQYSEDQVRYNADELRFEVFPAFFEGFGSMLHRWQIRDHLDIGIENYKLYSGEDVLFPLSVGRSVEVFFHAGIMESVDLGIVRRSDELFSESGHYSFQPSGLVEVNNRLRPAYFFEMSLENARRQAEQLRSVLVVQDVTIDILRVRDVGAIKFFAFGSAVCGAVVGIDGEVLHVVQRLEEPFVFLQPI